MKKPTTEELQVELQNVVKKHTQAQNVVNKHNQAQAVVKECE